MFSARRLKWAGVPRRGRSLCTCMNAANLAFPQAFHRVMACWCERRTSDPRPNRHSCEIRYRTASAALCASYVILLVVLCLRLCLTFQYLLFQYLKTSRSLITVQSTSNSIQRLTISCSRDVALITLCISTYSYAVRGSHPDCNTFRIQ